MDLTTPSNALVTDSPTAPANPAIAYLMTDLGANIGREKMTGTLVLVAEMLGRLFPDSNTPEFFDLEPRQRKLLAFPWGKLRAQHVSLLKANLIELGLKESTVNTYLSAVRGVFKWMFAFNMVTADDRMKVELVEFVDPDDIKHCRALTTDEMKRLLATCAVDKDTVRGQRDAASIALGAFFGMRACEVVGLDIEKFRGDSVEILGKGNKVRSFAPSKQGVAHTKAWVTFLNHMSITSGPLIFRIGKGTSLKNILATAGTIRQTIREQDFEFIMR